MEGFPLISDLCVSFADDEDDMKADVELPQALEKVLAFKNVRAKELGVTDEGGKQIF